MKSLIIFFVALTLCCGQNVNDVIINNHTEPIPNASIVPGPPYTTVTPKPDTTTSATTTTTGKSTTSTSTTVITTSTSTTSSTPIPITTTTVTPSPTSTTPIPPTSSSTTVKPTEKPVPPKPAPTDRKFDGPSFVGGIVLASGLMAIGFVAFKFYKARTELNYHTL